MKSRRSNATDKLARKPKEPSAATALFIARSRKALTRHPKGEISGEFHPRKVPTAIAFV
jgi:hypothetical protein